MTGLVEIAYRPLGAFANAGRSPDKHRARQGDVQQEPGQLLGSDDLHNVRLYRTLIAWALPAAKAPPLTNFLGFVILSLLC